MSKLEELAFMVAVSAPEKHPFAEAQVSIPWWVVNEIRAELSRTGFDWRKAIRTRDAILRPSAETVFDNAGVES
jgi:hypothetical protein